MARNKGRETKGRREQAGNLWREKLGGTDGIAVGIAYMKCDDGNVVGTG
jgi:hypothetical protein